MGKRRSTHETISASHRLIELFWTLAPGFTRWAESHMQEEGLTVQRVRLLLLLEDNGPMKMSMLSDKLGVSATNVTALVDALEKDEMVARKAHPSDRRATLIEITPKAKGRLDCDCTEFKDKVADIFSSYSEPEKRDFIMLLERLHDALVAREILEPLQPWQIS